MKAGTNGRKICESWKVWSYLKLLLYQYLLQHRYNFLVSVPKRTPLCLLWTEREHNGNNQNDVNRYLLSCVWGSCFYQLRLHDLCHHCHYRHCHLLRASRGPGTMHGTLPKWSNIILKAILQSGYNHSHFIDDKTEVQRR